ncbi:MAG: chorismate synthase [Ferruginibacter sp.]
MNSIGRIFRLTIFGESHGPSVGIIIDGCPPGLPLSIVDFNADIEKRKGGLQKGTTPRAEADTPIILSGSFNERTTGSPLTIIFENNNTRSDDYKERRNIPRPGHADFVASKKFGGFEDYRGGGHFSGRLTVCLVAAGVIAKKILSECSGRVSCTASIVEAGGETDVEAAIQKAIDGQDSIGGIIECIVDGLPIGLGEPFFDSAESLISHAVFAIPAIKGIEFGAGFKAANMKGSEHNDALENESGKTITNNAGGIVGGLTNGNPLVFRVVIKPTSSTPKEQQSLNIESGSVENFTVKGRHDLCIALRVPVVLEAVTACVMADLFLMQNLYDR